MNEQAQLTDEEIFLAWRRVINRDRRALRQLTDKLAIADRQRTELRTESAVLRAKLDAVPVAAISLLLEAYEREGYIFGYLPERNAITEWLAQHEPQAAQP